MGSLELMFYEHASVAGGEAWFICREDNPRLADAQKQEGTLMGRRQLTPEEFLAVNLATKGESYAHRRWPEEVVRAVIKTDLVKASATQPAEPRRAATRVKALRARFRAMLRGRRRRTGSLAATTS